MNKVSHDQPRNTHNSRNTSAIFQDTHLGKWSGRPGHGSRKTEEMTEQDRLLSGLGIEHEDAKRMSCLDDNSISPH